MRNLVRKNFFEIAYGSLQESKYLIRFAYEEKYISDGDYQSVFSLAEELGAMLWGDNKKIITMIRDTRYEIRGRRGQSMLLTVLALGGTLLGATTIAGLLTVYQIRQTTDLGNSTKAIFAADAGIEWGLYQFFKPDAAVQLQGPSFSNGASFRLVCSDAAGTAAACTSSSTVSIRSVGKSANASRAFQLSF